MQRIKFLTQYDNYIAIAQTHIFFNFNKRNLDYLLTLKPHAIKKIHIYISDHYSVNENLKNMIHILSTRENQKIKIIIHIYKMIKEIKPFLVKYLDGLKGYQVIIERRKLNYFVAHGSSGSDHLCISFNDKAFTVNISTAQSSSIKIIFPPYSFNDTDKDKGIFETLAERLNPEQFKEKLIASFRKNCPEKILKSFKGDEDIWNYIMKQGEWKIQKESD